MRTIPFAPCTPARRRTRRRRRRRCHGVRRRRPGACCRAVGVTGASGTVADASADTAGVGHGQEATRRRRPNLRSAAGAELSLVAYSTPQEAYDQITEAFTATPQGKNITFTKSYGASGDQSRAVGSGLAADYVGLLVWSPT